ncbi:hypothetical protein LTR41_001154 [Exophiala xenobiotica]|nr:hypothetical protein LTR41_001154 [Exophiala xenobiotica]
MAKTQYTAGFEFIVRTSDRRLDEDDRRAAVSHASRARWKQRKDRQMHSWIDPARVLKQPKTSEAPNPPTSALPSPRRVGGDFSATQLPSGIEPAMIQDLVKLIDIDKVGIYPYEICLRVHPVQRGWFPCMISDLCCVHSMMFSVHAFVNNATCSGQLSRLAAFHYDQTLQLLQARINAFEHGLRDAIFGDSTLMVIITLAMAAQLAGDSVAAQNHVDGLLKIVTLRGGLRSLNTHTNVQVKVCRADLDLALRLSIPPRLFRDDIVWDCFIADRGLIRCSHELHEPRISGFVDTLDSKLRDCWKDVHAFSCLSNLAYQTTHKLSPETYNEMMISIFYRLTHLDFEDDLSHEVIRLALLTYCSTLFLTRVYLDQPYERLFDLFSSTLSKLCQSPCSVVPEPIMLWLMILHHLVAYKEASSSDAWENVRLNKAIALTGTDTWSQAHQGLRSVMWVDFVHDVPGRKVFDAARKRAGNLEANDVECASG